MTQTAHEARLHHAPAPPARRRRMPSNGALAAVVAVLLLVAGIVGLLLERQRTYDRSIARITGALPAGTDRPPERAGRGETWLLVGSDRRADGATTGQDADAPVTGARADTIMLVHLPEHRDGVYVVSLPRDAWVPVEGHGKAKINAAYAYGGPSLLTSTIEDLTGVRIDHFAAIDFAGFAAMTDALGGVYVEIAESVEDPDRDVFWAAGWHHLDGARALDFVRQRRNLPRGDIDRITRQQAYLKALADRATDSDVLANPLRLNAFLEAFAGAVSVDETVTIGKLRALALELSSVRPRDVAFMTTPIAGMGDEDGQSVVYLDPAESPALFHALRNDEIDDYVVYTLDAVNDVDRVN